MRILGLDPSLSSTGWALIEDGKIKDYGTIKTKAKHEFLDRLSSIDWDFAEVLKLVGDFDYVAIEDIFVYPGKSMQTPLKIAKVQGVLLGVIINIVKDMSLVKIYTPSTVKKAVAGNGRASKDEVMAAVSILTGYDGDQDDESDAIAVALTCYAEVI